jgi:hypothetical protein
MDMHRDMENGELYLTQRNSTRKVLAWSNVGPCKAITFPLALIVFHCSYIYVECNSEDKPSKEDSYKMALGTLMFLMISLHLIFPW